MTSDAVSRSKRDNERGHPHGGATTPHMRHRLNRGPDRALNRALSTIAAIAQLPDRAYVARRTAEDNNFKEIAAASSGTPPASFAAR
jgi:hypothetical protein